MKEEEAFEILGLNKGTTHEEVEERFRSLANERHPDRGGTDELMAELNNARTVALNSLLHSNSLIPMQTFQAAMTLYSSHQQEQRLVEVRVDKTQEHLRQRSTNKLRQFRTAAAVFGCLCAGALFLGKELPNDLLLDGNRLDTYLWSLTTFSLAVYAGLAAWFFTFKIDQVEQQLRELEEQTGTKTLLFQFLQEIIGEKLHRSWTLEEMADDITEWARNSSPYGYAARTIGPIQFAQFLIDRAHQLNLISIRDELVEGRLVEFYTISLNLDQNSSTRET